MFVTVLIATHNRKDEVIVAVRSALAQKWPDLEVLVFDDASVDGTVSELRKRYPTITIAESPSKQSACVLRNRGFRQARGEIVISLDDDCYFTDVNTVREVVAHFVSNPRLAVLGLPYIEPYHWSSHETSKLVEGEEIAAYTGCAAALRREAVIEAGCYREFFGYAREENDLALRLHGLGWSLRQGNTPVMVHTRSTKRDSLLQDSLGIRNQIYFFWLNLPLEHAAWRTVTYFFGMMRYKFRWSATPGRIKAFVEGLVTLPKYFRLRVPISRECYAKFRSLRTHSRMDWVGEDVPKPCEQERF